MVQIIPQEGLGEQIGSGLGSGLSQGLQLLAQERMRKMQQKGERERIATGLQAFLSPEESKLASLLPESLQKEFIQQKQLSSLLGESQGPFVEETSEVVSGPKGLDRLSESQLVALSGRGGGIGQIAKSELERRKGGRKEEFQDKQLAFKETKDFRKNTGEKFRNAKDVQNRLNRLEELVESGKLTTAPAAAILEKIPGDLTFLLNPDSQEFQKLSLDLTAGLAKDFGNRINMQEFKTFLKRVPSLLQTDDGKRRVIQNMKLLQVEPNILRGKAQSEIIKENNGVPPLDLEEQVEERISPQLDELSVKIREGFKAKTKKSSPTGKIKEGYVKARSPTGQEGQIPKEKVEAAVKAGYIII